LALPAPDVSRQVSGAIYSIPFCRMTESASP
jgi:hypothetical protein